MIDKRGRDFEEKTNLKFPKSKTRIGWHPTVAHDELARHSREPTLHKNTDRAGGFRRGSLQHCRRTQNRTHANAGSPAPATRPINKRGVSSCTVHAATPRTRRSARFVHRTLLHRAPRTSCNGAGRARRSSERAAAAASSPARSGEGRRSTSGGRAPLRGGAGRRACSLRS